ncbi:MAG: J domain-containing protein [Cyanobacteria bacterium SZAS LIN-3]|nr:J domain-containing protein [Cyanobacteria bacterium SZAS LIN-3]MBS2010329.1 J domain-containing protein [Cyanobacteria bacterium SZAS TMP-1]
MNELYKAYRTLGLEPGASLEAINQRYRILVMTWHPDKFYTDAGKHDAEQKLKRINHARDVLKDHFAYGGHNAMGSCSCGAVGGQQTAQTQHAASNTGPGPERANSTKDANAKKDARETGDKDSRRRADKQEAHKAEQQAKPAHDQKMQTAFRREANQQAHPMRFKISFGCAAMFVFLWTAVFVSDGLEQHILSVEKSLFTPKADAEKTIRLPEEWRAYQNEKARVAYTLLRRDPLPGEVAQWAPPFASSNRKACWLSRLAYQQFVTPAEEEKKRTAQALSNTRLDVERCKNYISFARTKLADAEIKLADPTITGRDRAFAASDQAIQLKFLQESQMNLKYAQQHLDELQGNGNSVELGLSAPEPQSPIKTVKAPIEKLDMNPILRADGGLTSEPGGFLHLNSLPSPGS